MSNIHTKSGSTLGLLRHAASALALGLVATGALAAEDFPSHSIKLVVPWAAGGIVDTTARNIGQKMSEQLGQPVVIDNRPGAGGSIGTEYVAQSAPDGYTLLMAFDTHAVNPLIYKSLPYDTFKDFAPVSAVGAIPLVFATSPKFPANSLADLATQSKAMADGVSYGSVGAGSSGHLAAEQFKMLTGANLVHVPFKGGAPSLAALMGDHIQLLVFAVGAAVPHIQTGKVKALALTGAQRSKALPNVPTTTEAGFPQLNSGAWMGILVPAGTPDAVVTKLQEAVDKAVNDQQTVASLAEQAVELGSSSPAAFGEFIQAEHDKWAKVIQDAKLDLRQ